MLAIPATTLFPPPPLPPHPPTYLLSRYLARLKPGETIQICKRNTPIAELRALPVASRKPRPIGLAEGQFKVPDSFFDPLPDDIIAAFEGRDE